MRRSSARWSISPIRVSGSRPIQMFSATVIDGIRFSSWWIIAVRPRSVIAAGIRPVKTGDDLHQRGFARAVFPHERVHSPRPDLQRHVVECDNAGKGLSHAMHFDQRRHEAALH